MGAKTVTILNHNSRRGLFRLLQAYLQNKFSIQVERKDFNSVSAINFKDFSGAVIVDLIGTEIAQCRQIALGLNDQKNASFSLIIEGMDILPESKNVEIQRMPLELHAIHSYVANQIQFAESHSGPDLNVPMDKMLLDVLRKFNQSYIKYLKYDGSLSALKVNTELVNDFSEWMGIADHVKNEAEENFKVALGALKSSKQHSQMFQEILNSSSTRRLNSCVITNLISTALSEKMLGKLDPQMQGFAFSELILASNLSEDEYYNLWNMRTGEMLLGISANGFLSKKIQNAVDMANKWEMCPPHTAEMVDVSHAPIDQESHEMGIMDACLLVAQEFVSVMLYQSHVDVMFALKMRISMYQCERVKLAFTWFQDWYQDVLRIAEQNESSETTDQSDNSSASENGDKKTA